MYYRLNGSLVDDWRITGTQGALYRVESATLNTHTFVDPSFLIAARSDTPPSLAVTGGGHGSAPPPDSLGLDWSPRQSNPAKARLTDPQTAHDVTKRVKVTEHTQIVLDAHRTAGERGLTGDELEQLTGLPYQSCGPRRPALERAGLLVKAGTRPNRRGNTEQVYKASTAQPLSDDRKDTK